MCNCNSSGSRPTVANAGAAPPARRASVDDVGLRYVGRMALLVRGAGSGRVYALRPGGARVDCDSRDAPAFLASPLFERWGVEPTGD